MASFTVALTKNFWSFLTFNDKGKIVVRDAVMEEAKQKLCKYVTSDKGKKVAVLATTLQEALTEAGITEIVSADEYRNFLSTLVMLEPGSKSLQMNYDYIITFERK